MQKEIENFNEHLMTHLSLGSKMWWFSKTLGSKPGKDTGGGSGGISWRSSKPVPDLSINRRDAALNTMNNKAQLSQDLVNKAFAHLYWSKPPYIGRFMTSNLGNWLMNIVRTQGAIVCVWGERKWMFKTITVTHILKKIIKREFSLGLCEFKLSRGFFTNKPRKREGASGKRHAAD